MAPAFLGGFVELNGTFNNKLQNNQGNASFGSDFAWAQAVPASGGAVNVAAFVPLSSPAGTIDSLAEVIQNRITMSTSVTVRDLRNQFPKVRKLVETQGEVVLTEKGRPRYRLIAYSPAARNKAPAPKDYIKRMSRFQPRALGASQAEALHDDNRGDR